MDRDTMIEKAEAAVEAAREVAEGDWRRPAYHFRPVAQWMNDPNGTVYHDGWYHVFYQHHPFDAHWGPMYWGHARSRDLVRWEHLPIALWPSKELDETGCFSGCAAVNGRGEPMLFYTSVSHGRGPDGKMVMRKPFEQWAAVGDAEWKTWRKHPGNPVLELMTPGLPEMREDWRDPFIFQEGGRTFMVVGMCGAGTPLFEAEDEGLEKWAYQGLMSDISAECPNFLKVGQKWLYLCSPFASVEYFVGDFSLETLKFTVEGHGLLDGGEGGNGRFYASNVLYDAAGRCVLFGWVVGPHGPGWAGCLALPRELWVDEGGLPRQRPVVELEALRGEMALTEGTLQDAQMEVQAPQGNRLELRARFYRRGDAGCGLQFVWAETGAMAEMSFGAEGCRVLGVERDMRLQEDEALEVRVFLDGCVMEVFAGDGRLAVAKVVEPGEAGPIVEALVVGEAEVRVEAWEMEGIW